MPSDLRICPHCGAAISGDTTRCPRCDGPLTETVVDESVKTLLDAKPDYQARTVIETEKPEGDSPITSPRPESANEPMLTVLDSQPAYEELNAGPIAVGDELDRVLNEQPMEFKTEPPTASIYQAQTIVGTDEELSGIPEDDSEPVGIVDSTPNEFKTPAPPPTGMKTMVNDQPLAGFSEARTEFFPPPPASTPAHGSPVVTLPADTGSYGMNRLPGPPANLYVPPYASPVPQPPPVPRAPYTPPPIPVMPQMAYAPPAPQNWNVPKAAVPSDYWLRQRAQTYLNGGYNLVGEGPGKVMLAYGKPIGLVWGAIAVVSVIGMVWYFLVLLFSGFRKDKVTIFLEPDGYVFEDGSGAAHLRVRRWRSARRWGVIGVILALVSLVLLLMLVVAAYFIGNQYEAELEQAYPEITLFENTADEATISQADVEMVRLIVLVLGILFVLAALGTFGGAAVALVGYVQAAAYHIDVPPLPGFW